MLRTTLAAVAVAALLAPVAAGADTTGQTTDPGLQVALAPPTFSAPNSLVGEGFKRTVTVKHTCRSAYCDLRVFTRPGTAKLYKDYRWLYKRVGYATRQVVTLRVPVVAVRDGRAEGRETVSLVAELRGYDAANQEQIVEASKRLYILDQP